METNNKIRKNSMRHELLIKAEELAYAIKESKEFESNDADLMKTLLLNCNNIINNIIKLNYGALCAPPTCSCGK